MDKKNKKKEDTKTIYKTKTSNKSSTGDSNKMEQTNSKDNKNKPLELTNTCHIFTKLNNCPFGISGKGCKFHHPKICTKFLKAGNGRFGCRRGTDCKFFHQRLCRSFELGVQCNRPRGECKFMHPKIKKSRGMDIRDPKILQTIQPIRTIF